MGIYFRKNSVAERAYTNTRDLRRRISGNRSLSIFPFIALLIVGVTIGGGVLTVGQLTVEGHAVECVVTGKDRTTNSEGGSDMRVYTENCGTFQVGDNWLAGQFASADVYGQIEEGETYNFETRGNRIPIISLFPNIVGVEKVTN